MSLQPTDIDMAPATVSAAEHARVCAQLRQSRREASRLRMLLRDAHRVIANLRRGPGR